MAVIILVIMFFIFKISNFPIFIASGYSNCLFILFLIAFYLFDKSCDAVHRHNLWGINQWSQNIGRWDDEWRDIDFKEAVMNHYEYMFDVWRWGKYSMINKEYRNKLKPFYK